MLQGKWGFCDENHIAGLLAVILAISRSFNSLAGLRPAALSLV
jgi:hypothetical protein